MVKARREARKGRAKGGIVVGIKKGWNAKIEVRSSDIVEISLKMSNKNWVIYIVYLRENKREQLDILERCIEGKTGERILMMGDVNARTAEEEGTPRDWSNEERRKSKDKTMNAEGREFLEWLRRVGMSIVNGSINGDEEGEITYYGVGNTVIDYVCANIEAWEEINNLKIGERMDSDHLPLILKWNETIIRSEKKRKKVIKTDWSETGIKKYKENLERSKNVKCDSWEELTIKVKKTENKIMIKEKSERESEKWWNQECWALKREAARMLREVKEGRERAENFKKARQAYHLKIKESKKRYAEEWLKEMKNARDENSFWKLVNTRRKKKEGVNKEIEKEKWMKHIGINVQQRYWDFTFNKERYNLTQ